LISTSALDAAAAGAATATAGRKANAGRTPKRTIAVRVRSAETGLETFMQTSFHTESMPGALRWQRKHNAQWLKDGKQNPRIRGEPVEVGS
jgi:hypothetical protein